MTTFGRIVNYIVLALGIAMIAYYLALGLAIRFGQSMQFLWLAGGIVLIARFACWTWADRAGRLPASPLLLPLRALLALAIVAFLICEIIILAPGLQDPPEGLDYIVVLGAWVNGTKPSGSLRNRIQVAEAYLEANPTTIAVLSGGQGSDEEISEAQCMWDNLTAMGIDPARLILEDQSSDTVENLRFSRAYIPEGASVGIVTNNFHIFRTLAIARKQEWEVSAIPVATTHLSLPHYLMREFIGVVYHSLKGNLKF